MIRWLFPILVLLVWVSCMPYQDKGSAEVDFDLSNKVLQKIYTLQDKQLSDSLYPYFSHQNATYRYAAGMAFASIQDSMALDSLAILLDDKVEEVRLAAAYAIGQIKNPKGEGILIGAFSQFDSLKQDRKLNAVILEAIGKCGTENQLKNLATIGTYQSTDTLLLEGQAWGIYRYALRGITSPEGNEKMLSFLENTFPNKVKSIAANYLVRAKGVEIDSSKYDLSNIFLEENDPFIKMNLAIILGKSKTEKAKKTLINVFRIETDYRVKCNIIRALGNYDYASIKPLIYEALVDQNTHVTFSAAQYLKNNGQEVDAREYAAKAKETTNWNVKRMLYEAAMTSLPLYATQTKTRISAELWQEYNSAKNNYEKSAILSTLGSFGWNYKNIFEKAFNADVPVLKSASIMAITKTLEDPNFDRVFQQSKRGVRQNINNYLREAILSKDAAMMAIASGAVAKPENNFNLYWKDSTFLSTAQGELSLPKEIETYNELQKAIDYLAGNETPNLKKLPYNHPINWKVIEELNKRAKAIIATQKGSIIIELYYNQAPGSVANFVELANDGFYDGKVFHRVVSNFVVQGGCPRGDGYGSLDYSIRSEFPPLRYDDEGYIGMASAGKDTEGTQWFITHSPTPHLDGRYTIFGKVVEGMNIVHELEVGDRIAKVVVK